MKILFEVTELSFPYLINTCALLKKKKIQTGLCYGKNNLSNLNNSIYNNFKNLNLPFFFYKNKKNYSKTKIDYKYLNYLEKKILKNKSIWYPISFDRSLGRGYLKDIIGYDSKYLENKDEILINVINCAKNIERVLKKFKPNIFCWPTCVSNINAFLFYSFCKYYNIKFITAVPTRFQNYFYFANDLFYSNPKIKKNYLLYNNKQIKSKIVDDLYKKISIEGNLSSDVILVRKNLNIAKSNILRKIFNLILFSIKHSILWLLLKFNYKNLTIVNHVSYPFFQPIFEQYKKLTSFVFLSKIKYINNLNIKYIYFPLHKTPEFSTQIKGNKFMDQLYLIESLSKNLPVGYKLLIKEHPSMLDSQARTNNFYEILMNFPNVEMVDFRLPGSEIVKKAQLVVILDGTSAVEAVITGVPVLTMVPFVYDFLELSVENFDITKLHLDLKKAILLKKKNFNKERKLRIKRLLKSILLCSHNMKNTDIFYYTAKEFNINNFKDVAKDYSNALIKELKLK